MRIRAYRIGDEDCIVPNEYMEDWRDDTYPLECIRNGESFTIVDNNDKIQCIVNITAIDDLRLYVWFLRDKSANPLFIVKVDKIIKKFLQNGFIMCTLSKEGPMQDRMHKYLGFVKDKKVGDLQLWVRR